jgi:hypothetical protein
LQAGSEFGAGLVDVFGDADDACAEGGDEAIEWIGVAEEDTREGLVVLPSEVATFDKAYADGADRMTCDIASPEGTSNISEEALLKSA